jgi:hypothetical protein
MNPTAIELKSICDRLRQMFPESPYIALYARDYGDEIGIHSVGDYTAVTAMMQRIGIGERQKAIFGASSDKPWSVQRGDAEGIEFTAYCNNLPPSCRIETTTKRIPKTQVVDTGDFIEVQEHVVKCGANQRGCDYGQRLSR